MRLLVTNDDGIFAEGLWLLVEELARVAAVTVVAPDREQSGVGTAVSLGRPLRMKPVMPLVAGVEAFAVEGTPADSVILAFHSLGAEDLGMVVSGVNAGANLGHDTLISGTVGAALQGYFFGLPALALSVAALKHPQFGPAAILARLLVTTIMAQEERCPFLLNVNLPNVALEELRGVALTRPGQRSYTELVEESQDSKGRVLYRILRGQPTADMVPGTDVWAVRQNCVSLTPLRGDLSMEPYLAPWEGMIPSLWEALQRPVG